ncbi:MAG: phosphosulfolactate synthase, partial [Firmicutes bacterium]|nr:phosphosulfolactate synthase [Bacillota bacterium]
MGHVHRATAWREVLEDPIRGRDGKPRTSGLTMVIDKGLGLAQTRDLLELASDYIDLLKISFGTSALYPETLLREKISLIKAFNVDVCPGGTLLEIALWQRRLEPFLDRAADLGFNYIEVSDGTVPLTRDLRRKAILQSLAAGFTVVTEVGKKDPSDSMPPGFLCRQAEEDLAAGASAVVVEARESGTGVGIYREDGSVKEGELAEMVARIG